jgi:hypothetical protein
MRVWARPFGYFLLSKQEKVTRRRAASGVKPVHASPQAILFNTLDPDLHWKLLLRFQYFRHPWRSRRNDGNPTLTLPSP